MWIDGLDRVRVFEEDELRLDSNEKCSIVGYCCAIRTRVKLHSKMTKERALNDALEH